MNPPKPTATAPPSPKRAYYSDPKKRPAAPAPGFDGIPAELRAAARWVLWRFVWKRDRKKAGAGEWGKVPFQPTGEPADSTDPGTWGAFDVVKAAYKKGRFDGVGYVFAVAGGEVGIDLDDAVDPRTGELHPWAAEIVARLPTYCELSPSGTGVKLYGRGEWTAVRRRWTPDTEHEVEVYPDGRFFVVTGAIFGDARGVAVIQAGLDHLATTIPPDRATSQPPPPAEPPEPLDIADEELLRRAKAAANGDKFSRLWAGDTSNYPSASEAVLALLNLLAFWTRKDTARMDALFRRSGLMSTKWDSRRGESTWGANEIRTAIDGTPNVYDPDGKGRRGAMAESRSDGDAPNGSAPAAEAKDPPPSPPDPWPDPPAEEAYYGLAGHIVRTLAPSTEADPFAVLLHVFTMFGNVIGRTAHFVAGNTRHFCNLFGVIFGPTGEGRKGTSKDAVTPLFGFATEWIEGRVKSGVSSGEGLIWAVRDPICKREKKSQGRGQPSAFETVEADPGEPDKRLMVIEPEFASLLKQTERKGNTSSPILRQMWDCVEVIGSLTRNDPAKATRAYASVIAHITNEEFVRYLTATEMANGFMNRYLMAAVRRSQFLPEDDEVRLSPEDVAGLRTKLAAAAAFAGTVGEVRRRRACRPLWRAIYLLTNGKRVGLTGALTSRATQQVIRLAMLYALLDGVAEVYPVHLLAAVAAWDYCERSVQFLFGDRTGDDLADDILALLKEAGPAGLTRTDLQKPENLGKHVCGEKLSRPLRALERAGLARREEGKAKGKADADQESPGGRPPERWFHTGRPAVSELLVTARAEFAKVPPDVAVPPSTGPTGRGFHPFPPVSPNPGDTPAAESPPEVDTGRGFPPFPPVPPHPGDTPASPPPPSGRRRFRSDSRRGHLR